jgi:uncharacterized protein
VPDQYAELLRRKGEAHEAAYLESLRAAGRDVVDVLTADRWDFEAAARNTRAAMRDGADVIYQATFVQGDWRGRADFLERIDRTTALGAWGYEAVDAKLARAEKPTYVLQLCFYSEAIAAMQGVPPEAIHVLLGIGERRTLRLADFAAYYRRVRHGFEAALRRGEPTEPYRVEHCALCEFRQVCEEGWVREDHLVLVAGIRRDQVKRLRAGGIATLTSLAAARPGTRVDRLAEHTFEALREQAELQDASRSTDRPEWRALPSEAGRGFQRLPPPSSGDVFFDIEGDPFWEPARGLHFLFGLLVAEGEQWRYRSLWAHDRAGERAMYEGLVDFLTERLAAHPDMHVYHYGAYETTAVKQLMGVYATRESAVDELLRREVFVDLHGVVRQGLRVGVSSYSLKDVEELAEFQRRTDIRSGTSAVLEYEQWMDARDDAMLKGIAAYNEEDCRATLALRDWLVSQRPDGAAWAHGAEPQPVGDERRASDARREALRQALIAGAAEGSQRWLAGELLEYHRREARPAWWWFFARCAMSADELIDDAESIGGLAPAGRPTRSKMSLVHRFTFPVQQHKLAPGDQAVDPATGKAAGTVESIDDIAGTLALRRGLKASAPLPLALIPTGPYRTPEQQGALARLAESMLAGDGGHPALVDILARARPRFSPAARGEAIQTTDPVELCELAAALDGSYLFVQGPPGSGKTWTGARIIVDLIRRGRRVGITATTHKAIHNLLDEVERVARARSIPFRGVKKSSDGEETEYSGEFVRSEADTDTIIARAGRYSLFAGTSWLFARDDVAAAGLIDTLVIDEAGQVALADALAMGTAARNVVLLGDPLQLAQVSQGIHPPGTGASVLEHLLADQATVPPDRGIFLEHTQRMHPDVCRFVSEVVYDGRLGWAPAVARQASAFGTGLRFLSVDHAGNNVASSEEAARVAAEIRAMVGGSWTNKQGETAPLSEADFMVVAPYNAQVRQLRQTLDAAGLRDVPVGTVDKFQGREAAVVFYSMATSSADDVPRSLEFLFSRNRLNVAVSRAKCLAYVVASPRLLESRARTIEQMRLINALCRFVEMAEVGLSPETA